MEIEVSKVHLPTELDEAQTRMTEIRFECLVKMYDFGQIQPKSPMPFVERKPLPPQWFKSQAKFTLEAIKYANEYQLGRQLKEMLYRLEKAIYDYENNSTI